MKQEETIKVNEEIQNIRVLIESCDETNWDLAYILLLDRYHGEEDVASFKTQKLIYDYWSLMVSTTNDGRKEQWPGLTNDLGVSGMVALTKKVYAYVNDCTDFKEKHFLNSISYNPFQAYSTDVHTINQGWYVSPSMITDGGNIQYTGINSTASPADHSLILGTSGTPTTKKNTLDNYNLNI